MNTESSINITLKLILYFIVVLVVSTLSSSALYSIYIMCQGLVAGQRIASVDIQIFFRGCAIFLPFTLFITSTLMALYLIRHSSTYWLPLIIYIVLSACAWVFLLSVNYKLIEKLESKTISEVQTVNKETLSPGYFRKIEDTLSYLSSVKKDKASGLVIDLSSTNHSVYTFKEEQLSPSKGFSDYLIEETIKMPASMNLIFRKAIIIEQTARTSYKAGLVAYLLFITMGFAMSATVGLRHTSKWRLINVLLLGLSTLLILIFNIAAYTSPPLLAINHALRNIINSKNLPAIANIFAALCNTVIGIAFSIIGLVIDIKRKGESSIEEYSSYSLAEEEYS